MNTYDTLSLPKSMAENPDDMLQRTLRRHHNRDITRFVTYDNSQPRGGGGYSDVFVGTFSVSPDRIQKTTVPQKCVKVAVKRFRIFIQKDPSFERILAKEMYVWSTLYHRNVLPFLGFVLEGNYPLLIAQWVENGTLGDYLRKRIKFNVKGMVLGLASGLGYLHMSNVIHSDLKADNVLIGHLGNPLICDFGISHKVDDATKFASFTFGNQNGTTRWMARELFDEEGDGHHTKESDVWAFGMTIFEILTRQKPYNLCNTDLRVMRAIMNGMVPSKPSDFERWPAFQQSVWEICELCWVYPPEDRVSINHIIHSLSSLEKQTSIDGSEGLEWPPSISVDPMYRIQYDLSDSSLMSLRRSRSSRLVDLLRRAVHFCRVRRPTPGDSQLVRPIGAQNAVSSLNLTGCVLYSHLDVTATGRYSDIFVGTATVTPNNAHFQSGTVTAMKVAIKRLRLHLGERQGFGRFHPNERNIWSMLDHVNILPLLGFVREGKAYALVSEWMEDGTLREYLQNRIRCPIEDIILGIANGVDYLHGQNLVHCNLKADNILINSLGKPLICGFGNSRKLQIPYVRTFEGLEESIRWMAYELFDFSGDGHHTKESDVWAFGMTVYEILSKQLPYAHLENNAVVFRAIVNGKLPSRPPESNTWTLYLYSVWEICEKCWVIPASDRITIGKVLNTLKAARHIVSHPKNVAN